MAVLFHLPYRLLFKKETQNMVPVSKLQVEANVTNLVKIRKFIHQSASARGAAQETIYDIVIAVDEAVTNIIIHGYKGQAGIINIEVKRESDSFYIHLQDQAPGFDPTQVPPPDLTLPLEKRPVGKLGIHLIRHMVDGIIYEIPPGGGNRLTLVKTVPNSRARRSNQ